MTSWEIADDPRLAPVLARLEPLATTAFLVVAGDRIVGRYGDIDQPAYVASVRKSMVSVLFGRPVTDGVIPLDRTVGELGLDDLGGLLPVEREATVRDLLTSRSGIYHPASTLSGFEAGFPARGSVAPGQRFHYNNWDFNVLGTVYEQGTGRSVFDAVRDELAGPLGFEDFDPDRQRMLGRADRSRHLAYHFWVSARDLARLGRHVLTGRRSDWWLAQSTSVQVEQAPLDYGYLWWLPRIRRPGAFLAAGNFGQYVLGLPDLDLVLVHQVALTDEAVETHNLRDDDEPAADLGEVSVREFLGLTRAVLTALGHA